MQILLLRMYMYVQVHVHNFCVQKIHTYYVELMTYNYMYRHVILMTYIVENIVGNTALFCFALPWFV